MTFTWDPVYGVNFVLCVLIFIFGLIGWRRARSAVPLYIGVAFALFGVSHLATLLGLLEAYRTELIAVRTTAYLLVAFVLFLLAFGR